MRQIRPRIVLFFPVLLLFLLFVVQSKLGNCSRTTAPMERVHIIGGGPVGYCMALTLAKRKIPCVIYEKNDEIRYNVAESYPIGVNQRGLGALNDAAGESLVNVVAENGYVKSWKIFAGKVNVATQESGQVVGTTRARVNDLLESGTLRVDLYSFRLTLLHFVFSCQGTRMAKHDRSQE